MRFFPSFCFFLLAMIMTAAIIGAAAINGRHLSGDTSNGVLRLRDTKSFVFFCGHNTVRSRHPNGPVCQCDETSSTTSAAVDCINIDLSPLDTLEWRCTTDDTTISFDWTRVVRDW